MSQCPRAPERDKRSLECMGSLAGHGPERHACLGREEGPEGPALRSGFEDEDVCASLADVREELGWDLAVGAERDARGLCRAEDGAPTVG
eukprot:10683078-Heterocapsa_arctica.AAC.1